MISISCINLFGPKHCHFYVWKDIYVVYVQIQELQWMDAAIWPLKVEHMQVSAAMILTGAYL